MNKFSKENFSCTQRDNFFTYVFPEYANDEDLVEKHPELIESGYFVYSFGTSPYLLVPGVPSLNMSHKIKNCPNGTNVSKTYHPLAFKSCKRLIAKGKYCIIAIHMRATRENLYTMTRIIS